MVTISMSLGPHWDNFIEQQASTGRYDSATDVVRDALRLLEEDTRKLEILRAHLEEGFQQSQRGEFVENFSFENLLEELDEET